MIQLECGQMCKMSRRNFLQMVSVAAAGAPLVFSGGMSTVFAAGRTSAKKSAKVFIDDLLSPYTLDGLKRKCSREDFEALWQSGTITEVMASDFAKKMGVLKECQERGIMNLLDVPSVRLGIGYILFNWYLQISENAKVKTTSAYDYRHAVLAGAVGNIITEDKRLRKAIDYIPRHNVDTWTLDEFIDTV